MCRLLGYCTRDEVPLAELMGEQGFADFTGLSSVHNDGWGMAWYEGAKPQIHKSPDWAGGAPAYTKLAQEPLGDLGLLHFRWATPGFAINDANSHPFQYGPYVLAHNGAIHPQHRLPEMLAPDWEAKVGGTTDSERYFLQIMSRLPEHSGEPSDDEMAAAITATATDIEQRFDPGSLNAILLSPSKLYAINWHDPLVFPNAEQMRRRGHEPYPGELESYFDLAYRATDDAVVVASSGWPQSGWTQLPSRHVLVCDRGTLRTSVLPLSLAGAGARSLTRVSSSTGPGCFDRPGRCCARAALRPGRCQAVCQVETRSHTKIRVSPGAIACPAPRSP